LTETPAGDHLAFVEADAGVATRMLAKSRHRLGWFASVQCPTNADVGGENLDGQL
jgi:hypothetical protein